MDSVVFNLRATILVVDDTPDNLALMSALPSLIKRPVLDIDGRLVLGFSPAAYAEAFRGSR